MAFCTAQGTLPFWKDAEGAGLAVLSQEDMGSCTAPSGAEDSHRSHVAASLFSPQIISKTRN